jgi:2',3'-cyclic-nucleotide 2'-phosphodiesterase/3'-nucleotidase
MRWVVALLALAGAAPARQVTVTLLATTDLHGNTHPVDYYTGQPSARGLAKIASLVRQVRRENPNTLLIDCGDTIQGTPLESVYQYWVARGRLPLGLAFSAEPLRRDPMMLVMNHLGYRAMVLGNHEFDFGLKNLERARADARFPWLSANTVSGPGVKPFDPYIVEMLAGVKVAVVGLTTPSVPEWEQAENYRGYRFASGREGAAAALAALARKERPDVTVLAVHAGRGFGGENMVDELAAAFPSVDAIVFGHSHQALEGGRSNGVLLVQPRNWGMSLARIDFNLEPAEGAGWRVAGRQSRLMPVTGSTPSDSRVLGIAQPYHELAERYLSTRVVQSATAMDARFGRIRDTPVVDAIHAVQMHYAGAEVSFTSLFNPRAAIPAGPVTVRQLAAVYIYENILYAIEGDGRMVKEALENAARYFRSCPDAACSQGPLIRRDIPGFNFDMAQGVEYEIDLTQPEGRRIRNLRYQGRPLLPGRKLRIAVNSYRAGGSGGYTMFRGARILWKSSADLRDLMIEYYGAGNPLPTRADSNWRIVPPGALRILEREALAEVVTNK